MGSNRRIQLSCWLFSKTYNRWRKKGEPRKPRKLKKNKRGKRKRREKPH